MDEFNFDAMFGGSEEAKTEAPAQTASAPVVEEAPAQTTKGEQAVAKKENTAVSNGGVSDDFEIGFSQEMEASLEEMGISVGDIGVKISRVPIERYKASTAKVDRISFLTKRVIPVKYHFIEGIGSVMCFHGKCCEISGVPQIRYLLPIAVYQTDTDGNISGNKVELKILSAGEDLYKTIITLNKGTERYGGIDHIDVLVTCTDDQYQKISLTFAGEAVWRKYRQIAEFLKERWTRDGANAYMAVARKVDEATFNRLLHLDEEDDVKAGSGFDAVANQDLSKFFEN